MPSMPPIPGAIAPEKLASLIDADYPNTTRVKAYLSPLLLPYEGVESVCLGCSHYLYAKEVIASLIPNAVITDGTEALADLIRAVLPREGSKHPTVAFRFTGKSENERYARILTDLIE